MDILGKVYRDYFCKTLELDGNSHLLKILILEVYLI